MTSWLDEEVEGCRFADGRLGKRFRFLLERLAKGLGETIPMACQDWASTKAAYRFFSNPRVSEREILAGHFQATQARFRVTEGWVLVLHDTTEFSFQREDPLAIGLTNRVNSGKDPSRPLSYAYRVRAADAFQSRSYSRGSAARNRGREVLDEEGVQGNERAQKEDQSDPGSD